MRLFTHKSIAGFLILCSSHLLGAKEKHKPVLQQDQILVAAHLAIPGAPIVRFTATQHNNRSWIYAERGPGQPITLLDITDPAKPAIVSQLDSPPDSAGLIAAAGTSAISTSAPSDASTRTSQVIRLLDLSDAAHPKVTQQFDNVTAIGKVSGLVTLLANPEGVWILTQHPAEDRRSEERYARQVIYGESMY